MRALSSRNNPAGAGTYHDTGPVRHIDKNLYINGGTIS